MSPVARGLITFITWTATTAVLAPVCFFGTILLAGPHSDILPSFLQPVVLLLACAVLLVCPLWTARRVWRWTAPSPPAP
jgi:hypothetical protein